MIHQYSGLIMNISWVGGWWVCDLKVCCNLEVMPLIPEQNATPTSHCLVAVVDCSDCSSCCICVFVQCVLFYRTVFILAARQLCA